MIQLTDMHLNPKEQLVWENTVNSIDDEHDPIELAVDDFRSAVLADILRRSGAVDIYRPSPCASDAHLCKVSGIAEQLATDYYLSVDEVNVVIGIAKGRMVEE